MTGRLRFANARRGFTLVEMLVTLLVTGMVLAAISGLFSQAARLSAVQDAAFEAAHEEATAMAFLEARLRDLVLVTPEPGAPPAFALSPERLSFVSRLPIGAPHAGLVWFEIVATGGGTLVHLARWPEGTPLERDIPLLARPVRFTASGAQPGRVPQAVRVHLQGRPPRHVPLGAHWPVGCVLPRDSGVPLKCPEARPEARPNARPEARP